MHRAGLNATERLSMSRSGRSILGVICLGLGIVACSAKASAKIDSSAATAAAATVASATTPAPADDSANHARMAGMGTMTMTGDLDHDFLRMMSDHHEGLIAMAHETIERKDKLATKPIARRLDKEQAPELHKMVTMLEK